MAADPAVVPHPIIGVVGDGGADAVTSQIMPGGTGTAMGGHVLLDIIWPELNKPIDKTGVPTTRQSGRAAWPASGGDVTGLAMRGLQ